MVIGALMLEADVLFKEIKGDGGNLGIITLNRPQSLNALTTSMFKEIHIMLNRWSVAENIKAVVICGNGDKAFSAGGDIKQLYEAGKQGLLNQVKDFFSTEYKLNHKIHFYNKPFIALSDGITMGGGVGVSIHGSHRVVTEKFLFSMPETAIGFFPDIGSSYFLSRCPGETGVYLGLTGMRLNAAEAIYAGLADHFISSNNLETLTNAIAKTKFGFDPYASVTNILKQFSVTPETPELSFYRQNIDRYFCKDSIEEIIADLKMSNREWQQTTLNNLLKKSPLSLKVTLREIREGVALDFDSCMKMEYRICQRLMHGPDFYEGVRAVLIDKDHSPSWAPASLTEVTNDMTNEFFKSLPENEELNFIEDEQHG